MLAPNISNVSYNAHLIKQTYGTSNSTKSTALRNNNADGDAAVEINQNPLQAYRADIQQNVNNANSMTSQIQVFKDALADIEGKMAEMREPNSKILTKELSPMAMSPEEIKAILEEMLAKTKKLWKLNAMSSQIQIFKDALADIEGKMAKMMEPGAKILTKEISPMAMSPEDIKAIIDEMIAKTKKLWDV